MDQAYPLKESEESKLYVILKYLEVGPGFFGGMFEENDDPSSELLDRPCPFCGAGNSGSNLCIECSTSVGQE
ncbi:MAG: hypothetical protein AB1611_07045 [bacterium]